MIHEYSHAAYAMAGNWDPGPTEGKGYGIEKFLAERMGDKQRAAVAAKLGPKKGDPVAFKTSYEVIKALYEVIDTAASQSSNLRGVTAERAREMAVEFISKNKSNFSDELKTFISTQFKDSHAYDSLP